ncbi:hypothetical protein PCG10_001816, partial [Penicillium crustosum]
MLSASMQLLHALTILCLLPRFSKLISAEYTNGSEDLESKEADTSPSLPANFILQRNAAITSQLAAGLALGVKKMSEDEGEKFFLDYWSFGDDFSSGNISERHLLDEDGFSPARFVAQSFPFGPSYSMDTNGDSQFLSRENNNSAVNLLEKRDFKCPTGTTALWGVDVVFRGAYITVITVSIHSTVVLSTVTYSTKPQDTTSTSYTPSATSPYSSKSTTNDSLAPPARPTNLSTVTSNTRGSDVCPTGFYACSAVYQGGCCRTGRDCDTTSCPTTSSTTIISDGVTIVAPVATTTQHSGGNRCAQGWFHCADTVGGGCCPMGFACGASCTARDISFGTTIAKEQATATSGAGVAESYRLLHSDLTTESRRHREPPLFSLLLSPTLVLFRYSAIMSETPQAPLPFIYQFAAGAVAGVSE